MISNYMTQKDVIDELKARTGFYKHNIKDVLDALEDIIIEHMNAATFDEPSEMRLFHGWRLGAKRMPERPYCDPRDRSEIITPEKVIPYCKFKQSFRDRINEIEYDNEELLDNDE
jgi:nucleoid DNA-binding protein